MVMVALLVAPQLLVTRTQYVYVPLLRGGVVYVCEVDTRVVVEGYEPLNHS